MTGGVVAIAREDFRRAVRDRLVWGAMALVGLLMLPGFWTQLDSGETSEAIEAVVGLAYNFRLYAVVVVGAVALTAVVGERASGTAHLLLGLGATRRDLVLAKLCSRLALLCTALLPVLAALAVVLAVRVGTAPLPVFAAVAAWLLLYAGVWTAFTVGVSAAVASRYRALAVVAVTYLLFSPAVGVWDTLVVPVLAVPFTGSPGVGSVSSLGTGAAPLWYQYVGHLNPIGAFLVGTQWVAGVAGVPPELPLGPHLLGTAVLGLFAAGPFLAGLARFEGADLG